MQFALIDWLSLSAMGSNSAHKESHLEKKKKRKNAKMQRSTRIFNIAFSLAVPITTRHPCRDYMNAINVLCTTLEIMHAPNQSSAAE